MRWLFAFGFLVLGAASVSACSKENNVSQNTNVAGGDQCAGAGDEGCGVGSVCVLGKCRHGCTNDVECPQGSICVGDRPPYGCTTPEEGACSASAPCPTGLKCGLDGMCRHPCETSTDCPRNELVCAAGTCLGKSEKEIARWTCDDSASVDREDRYEPREYFRDGVTHSCNVVSLGWSQPDSCPEPAFADVFVARPPLEPDTFTPVFVGPANFACPSRETCKTGRYFCGASDLTKCAADPKCAACAHDTVFRQQGTCTPSQNSLPTVCRCIEEDVLPCGLGTDATTKIIVPRRPTDCVLQLPDAIKYKSNGYQFAVDRATPLLVTAERALVKGTDYTLTDGKVVLTEAACKLENLTAYACRLADCPTGGCTDVMDW